LTRADGRVHEVKSATVSLLSRLWENNYRQNLPRLSKTAGVKKLLNRFSGLPAVLVGAGPSLDKNVHFLPHVKGKAVIISCDAALKVLQRHSVMPDIVVNLDPQPTVLHFFDGVDTHSILSALCVMGVTGRVLIYPVCLIRATDNVNSWIIRFFIFLI